MSFWSFTNVDPANHGPKRPKNGPKIPYTNHNVKIFNNKQLFGIIMKVAKYEMRKTCKISGRNLKKQKSFIISECGKMDQKSQSKGDIGGNLLSASLEELEP